MLSFIQDAILSLLFITDVVASVILTIVTFPLLLLLMVVQQLMEWLEQ